MNTPPTSGSAARRIQVRLVHAGWVVLVATLALGHATALRNTLAVLVPLATLGLYLRDWRALPCKAALAAVLLWASLSIFWSAAPDASWSKWRTDLFLPALAGVGAFYLARSAERFPTLLIGCIAGLALLALQSAFAHVPAEWIPEAWGFVQTAGIVRPLPRWYPGPGDATMYATFCIAPLFVAWQKPHWLFAGAGTAAESRRAARRERRILACAFASVAFILATSNNRNAVLIAPAILILLVVLSRRRADPERHPTDPARPVSRLQRARRIGRRVSGYAALAIVVVAVAGTLEFGARERLQYLQEPVDSDSAALELLSKDTRPMIWRYYFERGLQHPWIGIGFGRTVPGIGFQTEKDETLKAIEPNAYIHAHNLLLDWWLQLGVVGLALIATLAVALWRTSSRLVARVPMAQRHTARVLRVGIGVTLLATLMRNLTDDLLVFAMATALGIVVGGLFGRLSRLAVNPPPRAAPRAYEARPLADYAMASGGAQRAP